jgi:hypothetical protein
MSTQETFRFGKVQGSWFMSLNLTIQQQSNARIDRAGNIVSSLRAWRMKDKLIPLGSNEMLDRLTAAA